MPTERNRVAVITGASSGIGRVTAKALAQQGWHVIGHGRDAGRTAAAESEIRAAAASGGKVDMIRGDLAILADVARLSDEISGLTDRIDVLINNAGGMRDSQLITSEGNEATFAGNHLGHFLLTRQLTPLLLKAAADSPAGSTRIINVSSMAHALGQGIDWNNLQHLRDWTSMGSYHVAKLAAILLTRELAKRLGDKGIVAHAMHPGIADTNFASHTPVETQQALAALDSMTAEQGADTLIWLATAAEPGQENGLYYFSRAVEEPAPVATDPGTAERLWRESEALVAAAGY
jgi:NAD(P)-dependent dehydrogenase (short-subunit alcohol dehydrogenase family)